MRKVIIQIDWYTKIVLTLIAVLLAGVLVKSYFPSHIPETRASAAGVLSGDVRSLGYTKRMAHLEGSDHLAEYLYLYALQGLPQKKAFEIVDESSILSDYPFGKRYAKCLMVSERNEVYGHLPREVIETALRSGRFEVNSYGIVKRPLKVELVSNSIVREEE